MKKLTRLVVLYLLTSNLALAAEYSLPLGLKWGMTANEIDKQVSGKLTFESSGTKEDMQMIGDEVRNYKGNLDGYETESVEMEFLRGKFFGISSQLPDKQDSLSEFNKFVANMIEKYGEPKIPPAESSSKSTKVWKFTNDTVAIALRQSSDEGEQMRWMYLQPSVMEKAQKENAIVEEKKRKEAEKKDPEHVFKMKFCKYPNLLAVAFYDQVPIEKGCIYSLAPQGFALTVTQSVPGGLLSELKMGQLMASPFL